MNAGIRMVLVGLALTCPAAGAGERTAASLPPVTAQAVLYVTDCAQRALPSQQAVGEWTGQHNFSQVYNTRQRLMAEIGRACQRTGVEQIHVVARMRARSAELVALADLDK
ncbi:hypothetical protein [Lysobacter terrae]